MTTILDALKYLIKMSLYLILKREEFEAFANCPYVWKRDLGTTKFFFGANFVSARFGNYKEFWELQMGITKIYQNKKYQF